MTQRKPKAKQAVKAPTEAVQRVFTESNTKVAQQAKTSTKTPQKATAKVVVPKPTIASLSSEVDSLKARLENSKKYSDELEGKLIFASTKIHNLELDIRDLEDETYWEYTKRKVLDFFTFGY